MNYISPIYLNIPIYVILLLLEYILGNLHNFAFSYIPWNVFDLVIQHDKTM